MEVAIQLHEQGNPGVQHHRLPPDHHRPPAHQPRALLPPRGLPLFLFHLYAKDVLLPSLLPTTNNSLSSILSAALLAPLQLLWIHTITTKPIAANANSLRQRLPSLTTCVRFAPRPLAVLEAVASWLVARYATNIPIILAEQTALAFTVRATAEALTSPDPAEAIAVKRGIALHAVSVVPAFLTCMATLPARLVLVRMAVAAGGEWTEDSTLAPLRAIVPIDPRLRGHHPCGLLDAWRALPRETWARACRIQAGAFLLSTGIFFVGLWVYRDFHEDASLSMMWFYP
ncbi:uncharacterized protein DSM5745_09645 [Aspergillus mulundensis]|uniref:Uncharacterized protein n=1 Tax=Aspergillus mulundensis TaxID=1810919 RepID=A0A3D8QVQ8_9EURO|nr:hypothetical protein DSM5745_09645 [Aspergillus mulundensis]RDW65906.1 hypothetical protein DSM5745_09645 [Aspergillus mulundensis]